MRRVELAAATLLGLTAWAGLIWAYRTWGDRTIVAAMLLILLPLCFDAYRQIRDTYRSGP